MLADIDWAQKYRPQSIGDLVLPTALADRLARFEREKGGMSMLFYGSPGTGKTTAARLINPDNTLVINCPEVTQATLVGGIERICSSVTFDGARRVVVLDEGDCFKPAVQEVLRGVVERFSKTTDFIMTANQPGKLSAALHSRLYPVNFKPINDRELVNRIVTRMKNVLIAEGRDPASIPSAYLLNMVMLEFPDQRRMLKRLQYEFGTVRPLAA